MIDCYVIDDEQPAVEVLESYIRQSAALHLAGSSCSAVEGLEMIRVLRPRVVFLDIEMPELSGLEITGLLDKNILVVFCTAYSEYAIKSYELRATDYLVKPITRQRFLKTVQRITELAGTSGFATGQSPSENYITVKAEHKGKIIKIELDEIDFVESRGNYVLIHRGVQKILSYTSMKDVEEKLPQSMFLRVHRSYIVAFRLIACIEYDQVCFRNSRQRLPIGAHYHESVMEKLRDKLL
jgi:DNA-binding LytR/AlgR family response regulator